MIHKVCARVRFLTESNNPARRMKEVNSSAYDRLKSMLYGMSYTHYLLSVQYSERKKEKNVRSVFSLLFS